MEQPKAHSKTARELFFWSGILATLSYRLIIVLNNYSSFWVKISWYVGTIGFIIYFIHRYDISDKRAKLIQENQLLDKINNSKPLSENDRLSLRYILKTLTTSKEKWNYVFIFTASGIALLLGIYFDLVA